MLVKVYMLYPILKSSPVQVRRCGTNGVSIRHAWCVLTTHDKILLNVNDRLYLSRGLGYIPSDPHQVPAARRKDMEFFNCSASQNLQLIAYLLTLRQQKDQVSSAPLCCCFTQRRLVVTEINATSMVVGDNWHTKLHLRHLRPLLNILNYTSSQSIFTA